MLADIHRASGNDRLVPNTRTDVFRVLVERNGKRPWTNRNGMAHDKSVHLPAAGAEFVKTGQVRLGKIGHADSMLFSTQAMVAQARAHFERVL